MDLYKYFFVAIYMVNGSIAFSTQAVEVYAPSPHHKIDIPLESINPDIRDKIKINLSSYIHGEEIEQYKKDSYSVAYTAAFCLSMWERTLDKLGLLPDSQCIQNWKDRKDLIINAWVLSRFDNAFYSPSDSTLNFTYKADWEFDQFNKSYISRSKDHMCRLFSVVAHETGHAFLDAVKPDLNYPNSEYARALHEVFGDITAIIASMRVKIINRNFDGVIKDLNTGNITEIVGINNVCIRKAADHYGYTIYEHHHMSKPFTKFFFGMLKITSMTNSYVINKPQKILST